MMMMVPLLLHLASSVAIHVEWIIISSSSSSSSSSSNRKSTNTGVKYRTMVPCSSSTNFFFFGDVSKVCGESNQGASLGIQTATGWWSETYYKMGYQFHR